MSKLTKLEKAEMAQVVAILPRGSVFAQSADKRMTVLTVPEGPETVHVATAIAARSEEKVSRKRGKYVALQHYVDGRIVAMPRPKNLDSLAWSLCHAMCNM